MRRRGNVVWDAARAGRVLVHNHAGPSALPRGFAGRVLLLRDAVAPWSGACDVHVRLVTDPLIRRLNRAWRGVDEATDVLARQRITVLRPGQRRAPARWPHGQDLGEVVVSAPYARAQAAELGCTYEQRLYRLVVHGLAHLHGFVHETDADEAQMMDKERAMQEALPPELRYPLPLDE